MPFREQPALIQIYLAHYNLKEEIIPLIVCRLGNTLKFASAYSLSLRTPASDFLYRFFLNISFTRILGVKNSIWISMIETEERQSILSSGDAQSIEICCIAKNRPQLLILCRDFNQLLFTYD